MQKRIRHHFSGDGNGNLIFSHSCLLWLAKHFDRVCFHKHSQHSHGPHLSLSEDQILASRLGWSQVDNLRL